MKLVTALLVSFSVFAFGQSIDATKLAEVPKRMQEFVDKGEIAGAVTLVAQNGQVAQLAAVGKANIAKGRELKTDDLFWIASMTKPMTSVGVLMLRDEGKLDLDDAVEKYLPEFKGQWLVDTKSADQVTLKRSPRPITIHDLLTHTSGLGDVPPPRPTCSLAELCMAYAREPLQFAPGSKWQYCNPGLNTLGRIIEVVSGQPYAEFMQQRLFDPLGMKETTFWPTAEQAPRVVTSYRRDGESAPLAETTVIFTKGALTDRQRTAFPSGGLYSTARDVAQFYFMLLAGGTREGRRILKEETIAEMTRPQTGDLKVGFIPGSSWGLGFSLVQESQGTTAALAPGSFGHGGAFGTQSWADPKHNALYILMIQRAGLPNSDNSDMRRVFQDTAAAALAP